MPWSHLVFQGGGFLRGKNQGRTLPGLLNDRGYYTAMITSNFLSAPFRHRTLASYDAVEYATPKGVTGLRYQISNLSQVNTQFTVSLSLLRAVNVIVTFFDRAIWHDRYACPAEDALERSRELLTRHAAQHPIFLWSHILPPHDPYWVPPPYRHRFVSAQIQNYTYFVADRDLTPNGLSLQELRDAYDEMILYADHAVGDYLDWLDKTGRLDRSIVIISADDGELFDHHRLSHGGPDLYNGVIHIPFLIHLPGQKKGARIQELSQQADLLPTLLDLIGAPIPDWTDGVSLKPALEGKNLADRYVFSMNLEPNSIFDSITKGTIAVMDDQFKFVRYLQSGKEQLYRYKADPGETQNLVQSEPQVAQRMRDVLLNKLREVNQRAGSQKW